MLFQILALLFVPMIAFASSTADDPNRRNLEIEEAFRDDSGGIFIRFRDVARPQIGSKPATSNPAAVEGDRNFYCRADRCDQLNETGLAASGDSMKITFETADGARGEYAIDKTSGKFEMTCEGEKKSLRSVSGDEKRKLQIALREGRTNAFSLPKDVRETRHAYRVGNRYIYVDAPKYSRSNADFRYFEGAPGAMKEIAIKDYAVRNDGGSTKIELENGTRLSLPSTLNRAATAKYNEQQMVELNGEETERIRPRETVAVTTKPTAPCVRQKVLSSAPAVAGEATSTGSSNRSR